MLCYINIWGLVCSLLVQRLMEGRYQLQWSETCQLPGLCQSLPKQAEVQLPVILKVVVMLCLRLNTSHSGVTQLVSLRVGGCVKCTAEPSVQPPRRGLLLTVSKSLWACRLVIFYSVAGLSSTLTVNVSCLRGSQGCC